MSAAENRPITFAERALATSFDAQAAAYARLRPGYPAAAVELAVAVGTKRVLDLGAGTGKLTGSLLDRAAEVIAVEPLPGMLNELHRQFAGAVAVAGSAEHIPMRSAVVDAVVVGQAFHWFDAALALDEMARVLRPGGLLTMLWNHDDDNDPFFAEIQHALGRAGRPAGGSTRRATDGDGSAEGQPTDAVQQVREPHRATDVQHAKDIALAAEGQQPRGSTNPPFTGNPKFTDPVLTEVPWRRRQSVDDLIGLLNTYSYVIRATEQTREQLESQVRAVVLRHQGSNPVVEFPAFCQVWQSTCR